MLYSAPVAAGVQMDDVAQNLQREIATQYLNMSPEELPPDYPLVSNGLIDSFNLVDLALFVEEEFHVHLEDTELNAGVFDSIDQLAALIRARR
jgi:acyl carrier protein